MSAETLTLLIEIVLSVTTHPEVRIGAARGLGFIKEPEAVEALMSVLNDPLTPSIVRGAAAEALGRASGN